MQALYSMKTGMPERDAVEECRPPPIERPPIVRGVYRPLTLREVYKGIRAERPPFPKSCPSTCWYMQTWSHVRVHLARLRHLYGPHVHVLDSHMVRRFMNRPLYLIYSHNQHPCYHEKRQMWTYWTKKELRAEISIVIPRHFERLPQYRRVFLRAEKGKATLTKARMYEAVQSPPPPAEDGTLARLRVGHYGVIYASSTEPAYILAERMA